MVGSSRLRSVNQYKGLPTKSLVSLLCIFDDLVLLALCQIVTKTTETHLVNSESQSRPDTSAQLSYSRAYIILLGLKLWKHLP